jgi:hypothetical protein
MPDKNKLDNPEIPKINCDVPKPTKLSEHDEKLLNAPKVLRTHCYVQHPLSYEIPCPICGSHKVTWSEFESHLWCYNCEKDILLTIYNSGVFSGPIPVDVATMLGMSFDRINLKDQSITKYKSEEWNTTWVNDKELYAYRRGVGDER